MPPPKTNFEKLQDILQKRKGLTLDVSSSGALAASLDKCIVRLDCSSYLFEASFIHYILNRTLKNLRSTRWSESWPRGVCCLQSISALAAWLETRSVIMVLLARSTHISLARFVGMRVGFVLAYCLDLSNELTTI
jgi:hypothetical protein